MKTTYHRKSQTCGDRARHRRVSLHCTSCMCHNRWQADPRDNQRYSCWRSPTALPGSCGWNRRCQIHCLHNVKFNSVPVFSAKLSSELLFKRWWYANDIISVTVYGNDNSISLQRLSGPYFPLKAHHNSGNHKWRDSSMRATQSRHNAGIAFLLIVFFPTHCIGYWIAHGICCIGIACIRQTWENSRWCRSNLSQSHNCYNGSDEI